MNKTKSITKTTAIIAGSIALTFLSGCGKNDDVTALQKDIKALQEKIDNTKPTEMEKAPEQITNKQVTDEQIDAQVKKAADKFFAEKSVSLEKQIDTQVKTAANKFFAQDNVELAKAITDAQVKKAADKFFAQDNVALGKQIMAAANAAQAAQQKEAEAQKAEAMKDVPGVREDEYVKGNKDADIVLFEYSDYHCPFCKRFHPTSEELVKKDNIAVVFRPMPLVHANTATPIHEIAECVGAKAGADAFWSFTDKVFEIGEEITAQNYQDYLKPLHIDKIDEIKACYDAGDMKEKVQKSTQEGSKLGIQGTPTSILKNIKTGEIRVVGGAYPLEAVEEMIKELRK